MNNHQSLQPVLKNNTKKRQNYVVWDEYFMAMTLLEVRKAAHSLVTDAAIILNRRQIIISLASNSVPDDGAKESYIHHAEYKATQRSEDGKVMYTTSYPCDKCAEVIVQAGISEVIYFYKNTIIDDKTKIIFEQNGVICREFVSDKKQVEIDFSKFSDPAPLTPT